MTNNHQIPFKSVPGYSPLLATAEAIAPEVTPPSITEAESEAAAKFPLEQDFGKDSYIEHDTPGDEREFAGIAGPSIQIAKPNRYTHDELIRQSPDVVDARHEVGEAIRFAEEERAFIAIEKREVAKRSKINELEQELAKLGLPYEQNLASLVELFQGVDKGLVDAMEALWRVRIQADPTGNWNRNHVVGLISGLTEVLLECAFWTGIDEKVEMDPDSFDYSAHESFKKLATVTDLEVFAPDFTEYSGDFSRKLRRIIAELEKLGNDESSGVSHKAKSEFIRVAADLAAIFDRWNQSHDVREFADLLLRARDYEGELMLLRDSLRWGE